MIVEYQMLVTETLGHSRTALMAALKGHNVKTAIVTYSGAGDSGVILRASQLTQLLHFCPSYEPLIWEQLFCYRT